MKKRILDYNIIKVCYIIKSSFLGSAWPLGDNMMLGVSMLMKLQGRLSKIPAGSLVTTQRFVDINLRRFFNKLKILRIRMKNRSFSKSVVSKYVLTKRCSETVLEFFCQQITESPPQTGLNENEDVSRYVVWVNVRGDRLGLSGVLKRPRVSLLPHPHVGFTLRLGFFIAARWLPGLWAASLRSLAESGSLWISHKTPAHQKPLANLFSCGQEINHTGKEIGLPLDPSTSP